MVELGQARRAKAAWQVDTQRGLLDLVAQQPVVDVARDRRLVNRKSFQRCLHPVVRDRIPNEIHRKAMVKVCGRLRPVPQLDAYLFRRGQPHDCAIALPGRAGRVARVAEEKLISSEQTHLVVRLSKLEIGDALLVQTHVPTHGDVLLRLSLLHVPVIIRLELHEGPHDVLVLVSVLISHLDRSGLRVTQTTIDSHHILQRN
mmetsp:Transcript_41357/g.93480  ORF Transcript_41357/g.93480 Transcript_41357/m.93480 type:complete len:202 (-) Transcript_41357:716-1321(-)